MPIFLGIQSQKMFVLAVPPGSDRSLISLMECPFRNTQIRQSVRGSLVERWFQTSVSRPLKHLRSRFRGFGFQGQFKVKIRSTDFSWFSLEKWILFFFPISESAFIQTTICLMLVMSPFAVSSVRSDGKISLPYSSNWPLRRHLFRKRDQIVPLRAIVSDCNRCNSPRRRLQHKLPRVCVRCVCSKFLTFFYLALPPRIDSDVPHCPSSDDWRAGIYFVLTRVYAYTVSAIRKRGREEETKFFDAGRDDRKNVSYYFMARLSVRVCGRGLLPLPRGSD